MCTKFLSICFSLILCFNQLYSYGMHRKFRIERYGNVVGCEEAKFIWFRIHKVGSSTIRDILNKNFEINKYYGAPYQRGDLPDHFKFSFVRNPWDRVVSCYVSLVVPKCWKGLRQCYDRDFDYFVDFIDRQNLSIADIHIKLQTASFPIEEMDFIGRFESFEEDLTYVLQAIGATDINIEHVNPSNHLHYSHYYTDRTREIIARKYKDDIDAFGYHFEPCQEYSHK